MMQVWIGGVLMVLGMLLLVKIPPLGGLVLAAGYGLYATTSKATRSDAAAVFWGFCMLCMLASFVIIFVQWLFQ